MPIVFSFAAVRLLPKVTEASEAQFMNALSPMLSSESGNTSEVTAVYLNASLPMVVSFAAVGLLPKVTEAR